MSGTLSLAERKRLSSKKYYDKNRSSISNRRREKRKNEYSDELRAIESAKKREYRAKKTRSSVSQRGSSPSRQPKYRRHWRMANKEKIRLYSMARTASYRLVSNLGLLETIKEALNGKHT